MKEKVSLAMAIVLMVMTVLAICTLAFANIYFCSVELNKLRNEMKQLTEEVDTKIKVNEEVTRAIVDGVNGGW